MEANGDELVIWRLVAYEQLVSWASDPNMVEAHTLDLLHALENSKPVAALHFREALTCGKGFSCLENLSIWPTFPQLLCLLQAPCVSGHY